MVCLDVADLSEPELRREVLKLRRRVQKLTALLRLALAVLRTSGFRLTESDLKTPKPRCGVLRAADWAHKHLLAAAVNSTVVAGENPTVGSSIWLPAASLALGRSWRFLGSSSEVRCLYLRAVGVVELVQLCHHDPEGQQRDHPDRGGPALTVDHGRREGRGEDRDRVRAGEHAAKEGLLFRALAAQERGRGSVTDVAALQGSRPVRCARPAKPSAAAVARGEPEAAARSCGWRLPWWRACPSPPGGCGCRRTRHASPRTSGQSLRRSPAPRPRDRRIRDAGRRVGPGARPPGLDGGSGPRARDRPPGLLRGQLERGHEALAGDEHDGRRDDCRGARQGGAHPYRPPWIPAFGGVRRRLATRPGGQRRTGERPRRDQRRREGRGQLPHPVDRRRQSADDEDRERRSRGARRIAAPSQRGQSGHEEEPGNQQAHRKCRTRRASRGRASGRRGRTAGSSRCRPTRSRSSPRRCRSGARSWKALEAALQYWKRPLRSRSLKRSAVAAASWPAVGGAGESPARPPAHRVEPHDPEQKRPLPARRARPGAKGGGDGSARTPGPSTAAIAHPATSTASRMCPWSWAAGVSM